MNYKLVKVKMLRMGKPIWRKFYINENVSLYEMGALILSAFNAQFEHMFLYNVGERTQYVDELWLEDRLALSFISQYDYKKFYFKDILKDIGKTTLCYDTGEGYEFSFQLYGPDKEAEFIDADCDVILVSGKGFGIIEDAIDVVEVITYEEDLKEYIEEQRGISYEEFLEYMVINPEDYFEKLDIELLQEQMKADLFTLEEYRY